MIPNALISGSFWQGPSAQVLAAIEQGKARLVTSAELLAEFADVLSRPKFVARLADRSTTPRDLALKLAREATIVAPADLGIPPELRDPKDLPVLACAVAGDVDAIVSGDQDLLVLRRFRGIRIVAPREALILIGNTT